MNRPGHLLLTAAWVVSLTGGAFAQSDEAPKGTPNPAAAAAAAAAAQKAEAKKPPKKKPEFPELKSLLNDDFEALDGLFKLHRNKKTHQILAEVPPDRLNKPLYIATTISRGIPIRGLQWSDMLVRWERIGKKLVLVQPELRYRTDPGDPLAVAVESTYVGRVLQSAPIVAMSESKALVIDMTAFFGQAQPAFLGDMGRHLDRSLVKIHSLKNFPQNIELSLDLPVSKPPMGAWVTQGQILTVHHSLSSLPAKPTYKAREADDRVGYFVTAIKNYSKDEPGRDQFVRLVHRWNLEKADPKLKKSSPKEPIVFYIEKTVPVRYRPYVMEGILEWNKAFEKIGLVNAIVARQQTATNEFKDIDPEDTRYNFFRWGTGDLGFAAGPSRVDPRTGQILDADILFDDSMVRTSLSRYRLMVRDVASAYLSPAVRSFLQEHPERSPLTDAARNGWGGLADLPPDPSAQIRLLMGDEMLARQGMGLGGHGDALLWGNGQRACTYAVGMQQEMALAGLSLGLFNVLPSSDETPDGDTPAPTPTPASDPKEEFPEEFIGQIVKDIVMHEVGHTLGLRHNYKASTWLEFDEINPAEGEAPPALVGSVMDYNPLNVIADGQPQGNYTMRTLGPYDEWAVSYGYTPRPRNVRPDQERKMLLDKIAQRIAEPGLDYATDEDVWLTRDPRINVWDLGSDSLEFLRSRQDLVRQLRAELLTRSVNEGESYSHVRRAFDVLMFEQLRAGMMASRYVGGVHFNRDHYGDPNGRDPQVLVDYEQQREALEFIAQGVFADDAYEFDVGLISKLGAERWLHWGNYGWIESVEYPLHDRVLNLQRWVLLQLMNPDTLNTLNDATLKIIPGERTLTIAELTDTLFDTMLGEVEEGVGGGSFSDQSPFVSSMRANLQREYVSWLTFISLEGDYGLYPHMAHTLARQQLRRLVDAVEGLRRSSGRLDRASIAHLEDLQNRAQRALEASYQISL